MWFFKKPKPRPKVFCEGCKYFLNTNSSGYVKDNTVYVYETPYVCTNHIFKLEEKTEDDPVRPGGRTVQIKYGNCFRINKDNGCFLFEPRKEGEKSEEQVREDEEQEMKRQAELRRAELQRKLYEFQEKGIPTNEQPKADSGGSGGVPKVQRGHRPHKKK